VGKDVSVKVAVGTGARVSVNEKAYVDTASVRIAFASKASGWFDPFVRHEKIKTPRVKIRRTGRILFFMKESIQQSIWKFILFSCTIVLIIQPIFYRGIE